MIRLYSGCGTRRLTSTTMVFAILVDTTSPIFSFFKLCACASAILFLPSSNLALAEDGQHARLVFPHRAQLLQAVRLPHVLLELQAEPLLIHVLQVILNLVRFEIANFAPSYPLLRVFP